MRLFLVLASVAMISCSSAPESRAPAEQPSAQAFLDKAAAEPGAVKTASGLVYRETQPGTGVSPKATDTVKVHYRGTLIDGTEFDSSYKRNEPAEFPLNRVIPCWTEGVQKMKVGEKRVWFVPRASRMEMPAALP